ncbi:MAG: BACON domain-containing protein [Alistipes sp.]|nr:BACON domain-containing protein [Alistipes sp.]
MKLRNLFYLLLCLPLAFASCTPEEDKTPETPAIELTTEALEFDAKGGVGLISYTLNRVIEGASLEATCEAEWVSSITVGDNITFVVASNTTTEPRSTVVNVTYDTLAFEVPVSQQGKAASTTPVFELVGEQTLTFGQEEKIGKFSYKLENPVAGVNVEATTTANWISQVSVIDEESEVRFIVAANTGAARTATIKATYGLIEFEVTIEQAEYVAPDPVITFEDSEVTVEAEGGVQSVAYTLENPVEGAELVATANVDWISEVAAQDGTLSFTVAQNDGELRNGKITLTYENITAELTVIQLVAGANPDLTYAIYPLDFLKAQARTANIWDITISETDVNLGSNVLSRITIQLANDNAMLIPDGTYSVENGGVLVNSSTDNSYSTYRTTSAATDITNATFTIANDRENATSAISCSFQVGNQVLSFEYTGAVEGFVYEELSDEGITEWNSFRIYSQWGSNVYTYLQAQSVQGVNFDLYITNNVDPIAGGIGVGTYVVDTWKSTEDRFIEGGDTGSSKINGSYIQTGGTMTVEKDGDNYNITFDFVDANGTAWKGTYVGTLN